jgi:two-component system OmpR family response regulator
MSGPTRILVVDDEQSITDFIALGLRHEGFDVRTAPDGHVALRVVDEFKPHLVVLDLMMPRITGWQVLETMERTAELADIPVIVLTAFGAKAGLPVGCHVMHKPFDREVLLAEARALT